jgi:hypothetical protein
MYMCMYVFLYGMFVFCVVCTLCVLYCSLLWVFRSLQNVPLVTAASSKVDVVAALRSADAQHAMAAAELMATQCEQGENELSRDAVRKPYADAGAVAALVAAMATHGAHPGAQEQLCRAIKEQAWLSDANQV